MLSLWMILWCLHIYKMDKNNNSFLIIPTLSQSVNLQMLPNYVNLLRRQKENRSDGFLLWAQLFKTNDVVS